MAPDEPKLGDTDTGERTLAELAELLELQGCVPGSADGKGRLKLPSAVRKYLEATGERIFVVTTLDLEAVRIYTKKDWRRNAAILDNATSDAARSVYYVAKVYARVGSIDSQGRLPMSPELRRRLGIDTGQVYFMKSKDHIEVYSGSVHKARLEQAEKNLPSKLREVEALGVR